MAMLRVSHPRPPGGVVCLSDRFGGVALAACFLISTAAAD